MEGKAKNFDRDFRELFDNAPCGFLETLPDGTIVQVNRTFLELTGHTQNILLDNMRFSDLLTVGGRIYHETHIAPLLQMQRFVKEVAVDLHRADRSSVSVLINLKNSRLEDGIDRTLVMVFEATDRRKYEQELLQARRNAERAVESEQKARKVAEDTSRSKDDFLAVISHELRTPLNAILGWTQLLQKDKDVSQDQLEGLTVIERNARVQSQLIEDLLDMGRILSGKMRLDVQALALGDIIDAAIDTAKPAADARSIRLQKVLDSSVIVSGDPGRLQQVFWNLLTNAIKFTPKGGYIRVVMQRVNSHVEVSVIDNGKGMSAEFVAHAFERFSQSNSFDNHQTKGLGLGLSIVKTIVEMHGGHISAQSEGLNQGSTFLVNIPVKVVHKNEPDRVHPRATFAATVTKFDELGLKNVRILVVDDNLDARELMQRVLSQTGADVTTAESARQALETIQKGDFDVLVSDIGMPDEDGYELIRKVRMLGGGIGRIRAVALTAFGRPEDRTRAMLAGYQMHLSKPVDPQELVVTISTLAGR